MKQWRHVLLRPNATVRDAIAVLERAAMGIALVVDTDNRLLGTVTDGDIRRAILRNVPLEGSVDELLVRHEDSPYKHPITAQVGTPVDELLALMHIKKVHQIPLVDPNGRVLGLATMSELRQRRSLGIPAMVMATRVIMPTPPKKIMSFSLTRASIQFFPLSRRFPTRITQT